MRTPVNPAMSGSPTRVAAAGSGRSGDSKKPTCRSQSTPNRPGLLTSPSKLARTMVAISSPATAVSSPRPPAGWARLHPSPSQRRSPSPPPRVRGDPCLRAGRRPRPAGSPELATRAAPVPPARLTQEHRGHDCRCAQRHHGAVDSDPTVDRRPAGNSEAGRRRHHDRDTHRHHRPAYAYYIDYRNDRGRFARSVLGSLVNWEFVAANLDGKGVARADQEPG